MRNRRLTPEEIEKLNALQAGVVDKLSELAGDDPVLLFALRRRLYTRLMHMERGTPAERTRLKAKKWNDQGGKCALCGESMEQHGSELDRRYPVLGYTVENTQLVHHECHVRNQAEKGYS